MADQIGSQSQPARVPDPVETQPIPVLTTLSTEDLNNIEATNRNVITDLNQIQSDSWTDEEWKLYTAAAGNIKAVQDAKTAKTSDDCNTKQTDKGYTLSDSKKCEAFVNSTAYKQARQTQQEQISLPDPCGTSELAGINTELLKFFQRLKAIKQWGQLYVNGTINKVGKISSLIRNSASIIGAILKILIQRLRDYLIGKIRAGIQDLIDLLLPTVAKAIKNTIIQKVVDAIFCKFKDIAAGIANMVADFLFELIGKIVNVPFCAALQWTNALVNKLASQIDKSIGPILDQINDVLGGVTKIVGSVFQALDFILGFESFLCAKPNCPEIKDFKADPFWGGPTQKDIDNFNNFLPVPSDSDLIEGATGWTKDLPIFGGKLGQYDGTLPSSVIQCDTTPFRCGPPSVVIFGGGGFGAAANAVVDTMGQIVGVDLASRGSGYTTPPFISIVDNCQNGSYASAYADINDDGEVSDIVIVNPGNGYLPEPNGLDEFGQPIDSSTNTNLNSTQNNIINDYVICLSGFKVLSTGIGYKASDSIKIAPNIPGLNATVRLTESGQIFDIKLTNKVCGLTEIPEIQINSEIGAGCEIKPIFDIIKVSETNPLDSRSIDVNNSGQSQLLDSQQVADISIDSISKEVLDSNTRRALVQGEIADETQLFATIRSGSRVGKTNIVRVIDCVR
jgi:hypothetical protein